MPSTIVSVEGQVWRIFGILTNVAHNQGAPFLKVLRKSPCSSQTNNHRGPSVTTYEASSRSFVFKKYYSYWPKQSEPADPAHNGLMAIGYNAPSQILAMVRARHLAAMVFTVITISRLYGVTLNEKSCILVF